MHLPVLFNETIDHLITDPQGTYVDCTLGGGGHFKGILEKIDSSACLIGIDQDLRIIEETTRTLGASRAETKIAHGNFRDLTKILEKLGVTGADGILIDLGVSSFQLDEGERGFSYHMESKLDMRMDPSGGESAWDLVNYWSAEQLEEILREYGEERFARSIARGISHARQAGPIDTTLQLVEIIKKNTPSAYHRAKHPARKTFQALRIAVNEELEALKEVLPQAINLLNPHGRLCIITFHSLEDRIVKEFFVHESKSCLCPKHQPICNCGHRAAIKIVTRKPLIPTESELDNNSRSRSAKLRVAEKLEF